MRMRQTEEIPPVWIRSEATYAAALTQPSVSLPSSADLRQRAIEEAASAAAASALRFRPPPLLNAATRHRRGWASAAQPWKRRRRVPEGTEMLGKHGGQSATVFRAVGHGLNPAGRVKKRRTTAERCTSWNVFYLSELLAVQVKTNNVASAPGALTTLNKASQMGGHRKQWFPVLKPTIMTVT